MRRYLQGCHEHMSAPAQKQTSRDEVTQMIVVSDDGKDLDDELAKVLDFWNCVTAIQPKLSLGCLFPGLQESSG